MITEADYAELEKKNPPVDESPCARTAGDCNRVFLTMIHFVRLLEQVAVLVDADTEDDETLLPNVARVVRERDELRRRLDELTGEKTA